MRAPKAVRVAAPVVEALRTLPARRVAAGRLRSRPPLLPPVPFRARVSTHRASRRASPSHVREVPRAARLAWARHPFAAGARTSRRSGRAPRATPPRALLPRAARTRRVLGPARSGGGGALIGARALRTRSFPSRNEPPRGERPHPAAPRALGKKRNAARGGDSPKRRERPLRWTVGLRLRGYEETP